MNTDKPGQFCKYFLNTYYKFGIELAVEAKGSRETAALGMWM